jgi:uncharacterized repeat protein (TIGR03943 family)
LNPGERYLGRCLAPAVFHAWTFALLYLLGGRRYTAFLRPEFGPFLALALVIAATFMLATATRETLEGSAHSSAPRALGLLAPILFLAAVPDAALDGTAFSKRFVGPGSMKTDRRGPAGRSSVEPAETAGTPPATAGAESPAAAPRPDPTSADLYTAPGLYQGRKVTVIGRIRRDKQLKDHFGSVDTVVYRFLFTCCAADALPLAIALEPETAVSFENDQWVRAEGTFELRQLGDDRVPVVGGAVIRPEKAPADPYLY